MNHRISLSAVMVLGAVLALTGCGNKQTFITIGTGGVTGVYYPTGGAIAKIINKKSDEYGIKASVESTGGSVYNINAVVSGDLEFGIAQSDRQYQAWHGTMDWEGNPQKTLRAVFSLHPEIVTLVAAVDSGIEDVIGLKGMRVNIGNPGSGHRQNAMDVLKTLGINVDTDIVAESLKAAEAPRMVQDSRLDAFFYTVGHPNGAMQEATSGRRKVRFIPITGMEDLLTLFPYYAKVTIPAGLYPMAENQGDTDSIGVLTTFITSADVPNEVVFALTKEVFNNLEKLKKLHPALQSLTTEGMRSGMTAPLHPGARQFYESQGWNLPGS